MSQSNTCRLCVNVCSDLKSLYDENYHVNRVYEITTKYFNPLFLNVQRGDHFSGICLKCWHNIDDFHTFQQSVVVAQTKLLKHEVEHLPEASNVGQTSEICNDQPLVVIKSETENLPEVKEEEEFLSALEVIDVQRNILLSENRTKNCSKNTSVPFAVKSEAEKLPEGCHSGQTNEGNVDNEFLSELEVLDTQRNSKFQTEDDMLLSETRTKPINENAPGLFDDSVGVFDGEDCNDEYDEIGITDWKLQSPPIEISSDDGINEKNGMKSDYEEPMKKSIVMSENSTREKNTSNELDHYIAQWRPKLGCGKCRASCSSFSLLREHFRLKHPNEICYVLCCEHKLTGRHEIVRHIRSHGGPLVKLHMSKRSTNCEKTHKLDRQLRKHASTRIYKCSYCPKTFSYHCNMYLHIKSIHSKEEAKKNLRRPLLPTVGRKSCRSSTSLNNGSITRTGAVEVVNKCPFCSKKFKHHSTMNYHIKREHSDDTDLPEQAPHNGEGYRYHSSMNNRYNRECSEEGIDKTLSPTIFPTDKADKCENLANRIEESITDVNEIIFSEPPSDIDVVNPDYLSRMCLNRMKPYDLHGESHTENGAHKCPHCPMTFRYPSTMHYHKKCTHPTNDGRNKYKCNKCYKTCKTLSGFREHMADHNGVDIEKCSDCPKTFTFRSSMYAHKTREHSNEKPVEKILSQPILSVDVRPKYKCDICDKSYNKHCDLCEHMDTHSGEDALKCSPYGYITPREHSNEKPVKKIFIQPILSVDVRPKYKCDICDKSYNKHCDLCEHMDTHSGEDALKCSLYGYITPRKHSNENPVEKILSQPILPVDVTPKYKCDICDKSYNKHCDLCEHMDTHSGEDALKCSPYGLRNRQQKKGMKT